MGEAIAIGRVVRSWGRHGAVVVEPLTHDVDRFDRIEKVLVGDVERGIRLLRLDRHGRPLVELDGIDSIDAAEALRESELLVPAERAERPAGDLAYFHHELVGAEVVTVAGDRVGVVTGIVETPAADLLAVESDGVEHLIPAVRAIVRELDVTARLIRIDPPVGLLQVSASATPQDDGAAGGATRAV